MEIDVRSAILRYSCWLLRKQQKKQGQACFVAFEIIDRLTSMTNGTANESYTFDGVGNRTSSHSSSTYSYQAYNRTTATQTTTQGFDANGNTVWKSDGSKRFTYTWDYENRLGKVNDRKTTVRHWYDALGRRVMTTGGRNGTTKYSYTGLDVVMDDSSVSGITKYQNGPGIDNKLSLKTGGDARYFLQDHLGSTTALTDSTGAVTSAQSYDSFGSGSNASFPTRYQYTGREYDSFSNLYYYRARFYDPKLGRFISEDPIGLGGGINQYAYVGNGPVNKTDPLGLYEEDVHYYLTYYLAKRNGCFSDIEARIIAFGNQSTDDVEGTAPGLLKAEANSTYHALHNGAVLGVGSSNLGGNGAPISPYQMGVYLHYYQDTYSHSGYRNPNYGHVPAFHYVDKTATNVEKAVLMARGTARELSNYSTAKCGCNGKDWDADTDAQVRRFANVPTYWPGIADVQGNIGIGPSIPFFADPGALTVKARILGIQR